MMIALTANSLAIPIRIATCFCRYNFRLWSNVTFPRPMYPLIAPDVLVESFERGDLISSVVNLPGYKHRLSLAETGLMCYLQMLLCDNFIHAVGFCSKLLLRAFLSQPRCVQCGKRTAPFRSPGESSCSY